MRILPTFRRFAAVLRTTSVPTLSVVKISTITARLRLAPITTLAQHFKVHRATIHRARKRLEEGGVDAVQPGKRGPKGPHKLTPAVLRQAQAALDGGASQRETARRVEVSHFAIAHAIRQGRLRKPVDAPSTIAGVDEPTRSRPGERAAEDQSCAAGVAVKRTRERALACVGTLAEAEPTFEAAEAVPNVGVLLAVPALEHEGLLEVGAQVYGGLSNGFFGLRSVLLTFACMALLRIKTPEQLTEHDPGTLGPHAKHWPPGVMPPRPPTVLCSSAGMPFAERAVQAARSPVKGSPESGVLWQALHDGA